MRKRTGDAKNSFPHRRYGRRRANPRGVGAAMRGMSHAAPGCMATADLVERSTRDRVTDRRPDAALERVRTLTRVLDSYFVDPLLGLVLPGAGDLIGSVLGLYVVGIALQRRMSPVV